MAFESDEELVRYVLERADGCTGFWKDALAAFERILERRA